MYVSWPIGTTPVLALQEANASAIIKGQNALSILLGGIQQGFYDALYPLPLFRGCLPHHSEYSKFGRKGISGEVRRLFAAKGFGDRNEGYLRIRLLARLNSAEICHRHIEPFRDLPLREGRLLAPFFDEMDAFCELLSDSPGHG